MHKKLFIISGLILLSSCYFSYRPSTCSVHKSFSYDNPEAVFIRDFSIHTKAHKESATTVILSKGNYCIYYYHCNGPVDARVKVSNLQTDEKVCELDFNEHKKGKSCFTVSNQGQYKFVVSSSAKYNIYFHLAKIRNE